VPARANPDDVALSLSKGGRGLQACFDKFSTGLLGGVGEAQCGLIGGIAALDVGGLGGGQRADALSLQQQK
jgi:hypothetical protein